MVTRSVDQRQLLWLAQQRIQRLSGPVRERAALRVSPGVAQGLGGEQGARRNQRLEKMLVKRQFMDSLSIVGKPGRKPVRESPGDVCQRFGSGVAPAPASGTTCPRVVGAG